MSYYQMCCSAATYPGFILAPSWTIYAQLFESVPYPGSNLSSTFEKKICNSAILQGMRGFDALSRKGLRGKCHTSGAVKRDYLISVLLNDLRHS